MRSQELLCVVQATSKEALTLTGCTSALALTVSGPQLVRATALDGSQGGFCVFYFARQHVIQPLARVVKQQQVNTLTLQLVVVVQPMRVDQGDVAFAVLGDDLLSTSFRLVRQFRQFPPLLENGTTSLTEIAMKPPVGG